MSLIFRTWQIAATYMGAIIGAGFASGQELLRFFVIFGEKGIMGVILSGIFFALLGATIVLFVNRVKVQSYQELTELLFGNKLGKWMEGLIGIMLWIGLTVMLAGSGAIFAEQWNINMGWGIGLTLIVIVFSLVYKSSGVKWLNSVLIPFLLVITVYISMRIILFGSNSPQIKLPEINYGMVGDSWLIASIIYVAYNMILGIVILASLGTEDKRASLLGVTLGGILLGALGMIMVTALLTFFPMVLQYQIPMLLLASQLAGWLKALCTMALWSAMVTTAVANGYGLIKRLEGVRGLTYNKALILILISSLPLTTLQFSQLVAIFYPIFGYVGLVIVGMIFTRMGCLFFK